MIFIFLALHPTSADLIDVYEKKKSGKRELNKSQCLKIILPMVQNDNERPSSEKDETQKNNKGFEW